MTRQQEKREARCVLCNHIAVDQINVLLTDPAQRLSGEQLRQWLKNHYPTEPIPSVPAIVSHRRRHLGYDPQFPTKDQLGTLAIDRKTGELVTQSGQKIEAVGILAALKTMVTIGVTNMLRNPDSITPTNTLEALKMIRAMGIEDEDPNMMAWQDSVLQPDEFPTKPKKQKSGREYIEAITHVIDVDPELNKATTEETSSREIEYELDE